MSDTDEQKRRLWDNLIIKNIGGGRTTLESVAHWNIGSGELVDVIECRDDDPDFDAVLAAIDAPRPIWIDGTNNEETAAWIRNVLHARCHTGKLAPESH